MKATGANGQRTETARHLSWKSWIENTETVLLPGERVFHSGDLRHSQHSQRTPKKILTVLTRLGQAQQSIAVFGRITTRALNEIFL